MAVCNWVIVPRGRSELFLALSSAYMRRRDYVVVLDRRSAQERRRERRTGKDRRVAPAATLEPFAIVERRVGMPPD